MRILFVPVLAVILSGCSYLAGPLDRAAQGAGKVVKEYCENVTVPEIREEIRAAVNKYAAPHTVTVECIEGGEVLRTTGAPQATVSP